MRDRHVGIVVIGRNEGERLRACLQSLCLATGGMADARSVAPFPVVYVDSGSTDGSVELARSLGAHVVGLDMSRPFTAARARNEGFDRISTVAPEVQYIQFVDGDCTIAQGWLDQAMQFLQEHPEYTAVAGRLRERWPGRSLYNRLCSIEWDTPPGDVAACGGIAMYRVSAFQQAGGFDAALIAGEEPELCYRLRQRGGAIRRLEAEMALHDAAMTRFAQWWKRAVRSGHAYAEGYAMHGREGQRYCWRETRGIWLWGMAIPLLAAGLAWPTRGLSLLLLLGYPALLVKVYRGLRHRGLVPGDSWLYALFCVLAKFPQMQGQLRFHWGKLRARPSRVIEYKAPAGGKSPLPARA